MNPIEVLETKVAEFLFFSKETYFSKLQSTKCLLLKSTHLYKKNTQNRCKNHQYNEKNEASVCMLC